MFAWQRLPPVRLLLTVLSGFAVSVAGDHEIMWALGGFALVPWILAVQASGALEAIALGALGGIVFGCFTGAWIPNAIQSLGSGMSESLLGWLLVAIWAKAPYWAFVGWLAWRTKGLRAEANALWVGLAVAGTDQAALSGVWGLPCALLGHTQVGALGVAQLAVAGGVSLISGMLAVINVLIARALLDRTRRGWRLAIAAIGAWLGAAALGLPVAMMVRGSNLQSEPAKRILFVQPDIPRENRWLPSSQPFVLDRLIRATQDALDTEGQSVDLIVWPENSLTVPMTQQPELRTALRRALETYEAPLVLGLVREPLSGNPEHYRGSALWWGSKGIQASLDKTIAVPLLESATPILGGRWLGVLFGRAARWRKVEEAPSAGPLRGDFEVSVVLCYEALFPGEVARRRTPESVVLLNLADDSWVEGDRATRLFTRFAAFRAIEQRLILIRVAHGGLSAVVDEFGRRILELPMDRYAHGVFEARTPSPPSIRERVAILLTPISVGFVVWWVAGRLGRSEESESHKARRIQ